MLKMEAKRREKAGVEAQARLRAIEVSIITLGDEDLLDLADIFRDGGETPLARIAQAEMRKRDLSFDI